MNTKKLLIEYGHLKLEDLPEGIRRQVESNEEALAYFRRTQRVNELLYFKTYERPPAETAGRHLYHVRTRLEATEGLEDSPVEGLQGRWQLFGYGVAAAFVLMIGVVSIQHLGGTAQEAAPQIALEPLPLAEPASTIANLPPMPTLPIETFQPSELVGSNAFPVNVGAPSGPQYIGQ